ncbi:MAG TPA: sigma-70 family RNA polymerase sigma factor [Streptosporangiaceae bacterium]|nr:sigma-70 family RNA polymerase sigma factor [Streptosporangiaceae bacterium]
MADTDASLVRMAAAGRVSAFPELMRRHGPAMHAYLARRSGRDTADDLLSEVFLRAFSALRHYDGRWTDARPWLYGIARNVLREHWRRNAAEDGWTRFAHVAPDEDPWPEVDDRLDAAARWSSLRRALTALAAADREVLLLVTWEGLTPAEAAVALGIPQGTARSRLYRARAVMRQMLGDDSAERAAASYKET